MQEDKIVESCSFNENIWNGITMTDAAVQQICLLVGNDKNILGLRLNIRQSGCAGFSYLIDKVTEYNDSDLVYEHNGAKLFVSLKAMPFLDGTELDYVQEGFNHIFKFNNPKAQHTCGCGESFGL